MWKLLWNFNLEVLERRENFITKRIINLLTLMNTGWHTPHDVCYAPEDDDETD